MAEKSLILRKLYCTKLGLKSQWSNHLHSMEIRIAWSDMHEIENNSRKVMTNTFPPHCLNFPELSYHKISYKILQVIGWSWRFPYHHFTLLLAKPLWVYGRQCRIRVEAEETWIVFRSGGGLILAPPTMNTMNLLQIISFLNENGRQNGRYHGQLNVIDI